MATFQYEALNTVGQTVKGRIDAASTDEAAAKVRAMGNFPTKISEARERRARGAAQAQRAPTRRKVGGIAQKQLTQFTRQLATLIDAGLPILGYGHCLDMSVTYGYEDGGNVLWFTDYHKPERPFKLPLAKLGPMQSYLGKRGRGLPAKEQLAESLRLAVGHWRRGRHDGGIRGREYLYGHAAYGAWSTALGRFDELSEEQAKQFLHTHSFAWVSLADAREAAGVFLRERQGLLGDKAETHLWKAAELCASAGKQAYGASLQEGLFNRGQIQDCTPATRKREVEALADMRDRDARIAAEIERALTAAE